MSSEVRATHERLRSERGGVIKVMCRTMHGELVYTADSECTLILTALHRFMNYGLSTLRGSTVNTINVSDKAKTKLGFEELNRLMVQLEIHKRRA